MPTTGVPSNEGIGDDCPAIREQVLAADILVFGTPIWMGQASSQILQRLNDTGWTIPAVAACHRVGEALGSVDFKDFEQRPRKVTETARMVAGNAAHLAGLLKGAPYAG